MTHWLTPTHARNVLGSLVLQPTMAVDLDHPALKTFFYSHSTGFRW